VRDIEVVSFVPDPATGDAHEVTFYAYDAEGSVQDDQVLKATWSCTDGLLRDADTTEVLTDHRLYAAWVLRLQYEHGMEEAAAHAGDGRWSADLG